MKLNFNKNNSFSLIDNNKPAYIKILVLTLSEIQGLPSCSHCYEQFISLQYFRIYVCIHML